jgi:hypothetical protein
VAAIQPAQVLGLKDSPDPPDGGSLDYRHKGGKDGCGGIEEPMEIQSLVDTRFEIVRRDPVKAV